MHYQIIIILYSAYPTYKYKGNVTHFVQHSSPWFEQDILTFTQDSQNKYRATSHETCV